jgi:hypothetical protein
MSIVVGPVRSRRMGCTSPHRPSLQASRARAGVSTTPAMLEGDACDTHARRHFASSLALCAYPSAAAHAAPRARAPQLRQQACVDCRSRAARLVRRLLLRRVARRAAGLFVRNRGCLPFLKRRLPRARIGARSPTRAAGGARREVKAFPICSRLRVSGARCVRALLELVVRRGTRG